jgi:exodeoxyribonuclease VII small subunit
MASKKKEETADAQTFEKSLARLEDIVTGMESGKLSLETMIERFEEGRGLVEFCTRKLNEVERKIEVLVKQGESVQAQPLAGAPEQELTSGDEPAGTDESNGELF